MGFGGQFTDVPGPAYLLPNGSPPSGTLYGLASKRPSACYRNTGLLYVATDTGAASLSIGSAWVALAGGAGGSGTVTSVGLTMPGEFTVTGSPVTTSGTLGVTKSNQTANQVYAGPSSGVPAAPGFRALVAADVPALAASGASHAAGIAPDPGATAGTTRFLREDATWVVPSGGGFSNPMTTLGDIIYEDATPTAARLAGNTSATKNFLTQTGTGAASAPPAWGTIAATDVPVFIASGASHAPGAVPDPGATAGTTRYLREDATWAVPPGGTPINSVCDFRLTLTSGAPIPTSDASAATLYWTPYKGNRVALYDMVNGWSIQSTAEISLAINAGWTLPTDIFVYNNAGVLTLTGVQWLNITTRATPGISLQDGVWTQAGSGGQAYRYVGTIYPSGGSCNDTTSQRYLWNYYHRVKRTMLFQEVTSQWTYSSATFRQANADSSARLQFIIGISEDPVFAEVQTGCAPSGAAAGNVGIGLDSTTANSGAIQAEVSGNANTSGLIAPSRAIYNAYPGIGYHALNWLEYVRAGTCTFYGAFGGSQGGIRGELLG